MAARPLARTPAMAAIVRDLPSTRTAFLLSCECPPPAQAARTHSRCLPAGQGLINAAPDRCGGDLHESPAELSPGVLVPAGREAGRPATVGELDLVAAWLQVSDAVVTADRTRDRGRDADASQQWHSFDADAPERIAAGSADDARNGAAQRHADVRALGRLGRRDRNPPGQTRCRGWRVASAGRISGKELVFTCREVGDLISAAAL